MATKKKRRKSGRPPYAITDAVLVKAEELAATGLPKVWIAKHLGMDRGTLTRKEDENSAFAAAIARGQARVLERLGKHQVINAFTPTKQNPGGNPFVQEKMMDRILGAQLARGEIGGMAPGPGEEVDEVIFRRTRRSKGGEGGPDDNGGPGLP